MLCNKLRKQEVLELSAVLPVSQRCCQAYLWVYVLGLALLQKGLARLHTLLVGSLNLQTEQPSFCVPPSALVLNKEPVHALHDALERGIVLVLDPRRCLPLNPQLYQPYTPCRRWSPSSAWC